MKDPKMEGTKIARTTNCRFGAHVFTWASGEYSRDRPDLAPYDQTLICDCEAYTWAEWQQVVQPKAEVKAKP